MLPITLLVSLFAIAVLVIIMVIVMVLIMMLIMIIVIMVIVVVVVSSPCVEQRSLMPVARSVTAMMTAAITAMMPTAISGTVIVVSRVEEMTVILIQWPVR